MSLQPEQHDDAPGIIPEQLPEPTPVEASEGQGAITEAAAFAAHVDLSDQQQLNAIKRLIRGDQAETHLHRIFIVCAWIVAICLLACFAVLIWHKAAPDRWRFLSDGQVRDIYEFLFAGAIGGIVTKGSDYFMKNSS